MTPRAVIDTNVLVPVGTRRAVQEAAEAGLIVALWSPWIVAELNRVLTWNWIDWSHGDTSATNWRACSAAAATMMNFLLASFETVDPRPPYPDAWPGLADPGDHRVWAAAVHSEGSFVVSDNTRDFPPSDADGRFRWAGIEYLTAAEFLRRLAEGEFHEVGADR